MKSNFQGPILDSRFFTDHFPTDEFLQSAKDLAPWTASLVPVFRWQELLYIAFSGNPPTAQLPENSVLVSTEASQTQRVFEKMELLKKQHEDIFSQDVMTLLKDTPAVEDATAEAPLGTPAAELELLDLGSPVTAPTTSQPETLPSESASSTPHLDWMADTFKEMNKYFQKSLLFTVKNGALIPMHCEPPLNNATEFPSEISLETPSPLRIAFRTQHPYHGFVVANEYNEKFFDVFNEGVIPDHLTIAPIIVGDDVTGMLVGIGNKQSDNKMTLHLTENLAKRFAKHLSTEPQAA